MRLLSYHPADDFEFKLTTFSEKNVPPYFILSHTWDEDQEVSYADVVSRNDAAKAKTGYEKLRFCAIMINLQTESDSPRYFWVDTCCINKDSDAELSSSINSMFRWYQRAQSCYVLLPDVDHRGLASFRQSRWFTRGWTLQELIAPLRVYFYDQDWEFWGERAHLLGAIHEATSIPIRALKGQSSLSRYSVEERMSWAEGRETTIEEDKAYCLFGILQVYMPVIYGEGEEHAMKRLREEAQKSSQNDVKSAADVQKPRERSDASQF